MKKNNDVKVILYFLYILLFMLLTFIAYFSFYVYQNEKLPEQEIKYAKVNEDMMAIETVALPSDQYEDSKTTIKIDTKVKGPEIEKPVITNNNEFYFSNLEEYSKSIYNSLKDAKEDLKYGNKQIELPNSLKNIVLDSDGAEKTKGIFTIATNAFEYDNPDIFYFDVSKLAFFYESDSFGNYKNYLDYNEAKGNNYFEGTFSSREEVLNAEKEIDLVANEILSNASKMNSDYEKIKYVHDWIIKNIKYDETLNRANRNNIYGALVEKEVTCGGYAKAFKYLMDKLNIECIIVQGKATDNGHTEYHVWNYVKLNGTWYGVDCTWDDPVIIGNVPEEEKEIYYTYFLKGYNGFKDTHELFNVFYGTDVKTNYPEISLNDL